MSELLDFFIKHWQLSAAFLVLLSVYLWVEFKGGSNSSSISLEGATALYNHEQAVIIDLRSEQNFRQGHIIGSQNISNDTSESNIRSLQKYAKKPIIVVCAEGRESAKFVAKLKASNFDRVFSMTGGIRAWQDAGLPLVNKG